MMQRMAVRACVCVFTLTCPALWVEDEAAVTGAGKRTGDVGAQLLAVTIPALIDICSRKKTTKKSIIYIKSPLKNTSSVVKE